MSKTIKRREAPKKAGASTPLPAAGEVATWKGMLLLAALVALFFHELLLGSAFLWEDFLYFSYPVRNFAATSVAMGSIPLWNPYTFNGMPFLADIQTTVFYIPCMVLSLFTSGGRLNFYWLELMVIAHYVVAGASMYFFVHSLGLKKLPALFAGAAYMLSGFMIVHAIHQQIITMVAWYPLILLLFRYTLTRKEWLWAFLTALVLGHSTLAGYPQLSLYFYFFLFVYFLFELASQYPGRALLSRPALLLALKAAVVVALSVSVAMIQLLPTYELSDLSQRAQITYEKSTEGTLAWSQLMTFFFPRVFGTAGAGGYNYWGPGTYWYFWETCVYLGALPLLLALMSLAFVRKNRLVAFFWGYALFALVFALGNNLFVHRLFFDFIPGFSTFRNPARMGIFLAFCTSVLSGFTLQHLLYEQRDRNRARTLLSLLGGTVALGIFIWILIVSGSLAGAFPAMKNPQVASMAGKDAFVSLLMLLVSAALIYAMLRGTGVRAARLALIPVFFLDMFLFGGNQNSSPTDPKDYFARSAPLVDFLKQQGQSEIFRVNTRNAQGLIMDRNQGMIDRIFMMEGYTPLALKRAYAPLPSGDQEFDLLNVKYKTVTNEQARTLSLEPRTTYLPRAFFVYNVLAARSEEELLADFKDPAFDCHTTAVIEKAPGFVLAADTSAPRWKAQITHYEDNRIELDIATGRDGFLVLSEIYYPGWKAFVDGAETEIYRTDYNLRGLFVPRGQHQVVVRFAPASYARGTLVTLASLLLCGAGCGISLARSRAKGRTPLAQTEPAHS